MDQASIIRDLLYWLDSHLEHPLSLDDVAAKAGYSKWHLQRMFKEVTGQAIGSYIRKRRMTKAAVALRLTSRAILEIALQYHFDSQQTFTRAFKKQFQQTPAYYRRLSYWNTLGLCEPIDLDNQELPQPEFITLPERKLVGVTREYNCTLEDIVETHDQIRAEFWREYLGDAETIPPTLYGLHHAVASKKAEDEQTVFYTMALEPKDLPRGIAGEQIVLAETRYAMFKYVGKAANLQHFMLLLFITCLPKLNITVSNAHYIEIFHPETSWKNEVTGETIIRCEYLIPIVA